MDNLEPGTTLLLLAGIAAALDRGFALASRFSSRVSWLKRWDRNRAHDIVEREAREQALATIAELHEPLIALAQRSEQLVAAVGVNGKPLHDRVTEFAGELREVKDDVSGIRQRLESGSVWMREHEALHAAGADGSER